MADSHKIVKGSYGCGDKGGTYTETTEDAKGTIRCVACGQPVTGKKSQEPLPPEE